MKGDPRDARGTEKPATQAGAAHPSLPAAGEQYRAAMSALADIAVGWEKKGNSDGTASAEKVLLTSDEAAERLGVGRSTLYALIRKGKLRTVKIGRRRLVPTTAITQLIQRLLEETEET